MDDLKTISLPELLSLKEGLGREIKDNLSEYQEVKEEIKRRKADLTAQLEAAKVRRPRRVKEVATTEE